MLSANCNFANEITIGDIGLGVLSGGGNLNVDFGGASAETDDQAATSPFGSGGGTSLPPTSSTGNSGAAGNSASAGSSLPVTGNSGVGALAPPAGNTAPASPTASGGGGGKQATALGPMTRTSECISLGPAGGGCVTGNAAVPIGLAALGLVVALFTWDCLRQRRRPQLHRGPRTALEAAE